MKVLNWIISVLILIASIGAAVVAFLLFQKREQMLNGWDQMAVAIRNTAMALDAGSGTKVADSLKRERLDHKLTPDELKQNLEKLNAAAKRVVEQRDGLAEQLVRVAQVVEVNAGRTDALKNVDTSKASQAAILAGVQQVQARNNTIMNSYLASGKLLGVNGTTAQLKNSGTLTSFSEKIKDEITRKDQRIGTYQTELGSISRQVNTRFDVSEQAYRTASRSVTEAVRKQANTLRQETAARRRVESELASAKQSLAQSEKKSVDLRAQIRRLEAERADLRHKLNPTKNSILDEYINGKVKDRDLFALVRGKICKVDKKWGIAVVDIGRKYDVRRVVAGRELSNIITIPEKIPGTVVPVSSRLPGSAGQIACPKCKSMIVYDRNPSAEGIPMTVVRNDGGKEPKYIGKVRIAQIHDNYCVVNVDSRELKSEIREGDTVLFNKDDMDHFLPKETASLRK